MRPSTPPAQVSALLALLEAARAHLVLCSHGIVQLGMKECGKPAIYTFGSPHGTLCKEHGRPHEGRVDLWPHRQLELVAAVAAADAVLAALPNLPELDTTTDSAREARELTDAQLEALLAEIPPERRRAIKAMSDAEIKDLLADGSSA